MVKKAVNVAITESEFNTIMVDGVTSNVITAEQYQTITGEAYTA